MKRGALQQKILWIVQQQGPISAPDVRTQLQEERDISLNAVQTVLNRLVDQGRLVRTGSRRTYLYHAQLSDEAVRRTAAHAAMDLLSRSDDLGLAYFVETIDQVRPDAIEKLEGLLKERRNRGDGQ
ncbi:BlaI/MecI/CopY family transcriptional regulator [Sulfobacillus harzensis]|uniref:Penicillinase repressor n=1 Tax=Sulfobacillus harzensis TaxID=2729629 RepID=A0A7Y0L805_9FIRM|nr:BlaI/MecI/CopY family transcriptional regulator [Sulfobacillus harzensis]NMP24876.1 penicillinase repressor [Sulfobacillus harzensis]